MFVSVSAFVCARACMCAFSAIPHFILSHFCPYFLFSALLNVFPTPSPLPTSSACHPFPPGSDDLMDEDEEEQYDLHDYLREGGGGY